jgi:hypothetical protein
MQLVRQLLVRLHVLLGIAAFARAQDSSTLPALHTTIPNGHGDTSVDINVKGAGDGSFEIAAGVTVNDYDSDQPVLVDQYVEFNTTIVVSESVTITVRNAPTRLSTLLPARRRGPARSTAA